MLTSHLIGLHTCQIAILMDAVGSCKLLATQNSGTGAVYRSASGLAHSGRSSYTTLGACWPKGQGQPPRPKLTS